MPRAHWAKNGKSRVGPIDFFRNLAHGASKISKAPPGVRVSAHTSSEARQQVVWRRRTILCKWEKKFPRDWAWGIADSKLFLSAQVQLSTMTNQEAPGPCTGHGWEPPMILMVKFFSFLSHIWKKEVPKRFLGDILAHPWWRLPTCPLPGKSLPAAFCPGGTWPLARRPGRACPPQRLQR